MRQWTPLGGQFGEVVRARRRELGMSQEELACSCGVTRTYISLLERGMCGDLLLSLPPEMTAKIPPDLLSSTETREPPPPESHSIRRPRRGA
jgi:transcriptional regulator with XRE-family HTH domain